MNVNFVIYDATGKISRTGNCPSEWLNLQATDGEFVTVGTGDARTQMVDTAAKTVVARPVNPTQLVGMDLLNVPAGSTVTINGVGYPVTDSTVNLDFTYPGTYQIKVTGWPYQDATFKVTK